MVDVRGHRDARIVEDRCYSAAVQVLGFGPEPTAAKGLGLRFTLLPSIALATALLALVYIYIYIYIY